MNAKQVPAGAKPARTRIQLSRILRALLMGVTYIILSVGAVSMLLPFAWMISTSLKAGSEIFLWPPRWIPSVIRWDNYATAWNSAPWGRYFLNTLFVATTVTALTLLVCSLAAYSFARLRFPGRDLFFLALLGTMMIPGQVTIIPNFVIVKRLGWYNNYWGLIIPEAGGAFGVFLLRQYFLSIPFELEDAARIDGASRLRIIFSIILPLSRPALSVLTLFSFMGSWNAFLWPLIITNTDLLRVVQIGLAVFRMEESTQYHLLMAASTYVVLPVIILFLLVQKQFIQGIQLTGMK